MSSPKGRLTGRYPVRTNAWKTTLSYSQTSPICLSGHFLHTERLSLIIKINIPPIFFKSVLYHMSIWSKDIDMDVIPKSKLIYYILFELVKKI